MIRKITLEHLLHYKEQHEPISMMTCYDALHAELMDQAGIDCLFIGDSVGTNMLGYAHENQVTLEDMIHHTKAVCRGSKRAFILADLPYGSYASPPQALESARLLCKAGADGVKFEGFYPEILTILKKNHIPTVCHLGYLPQTAPTVALQATTQPAIQELTRQALCLEENGADMLVLELIPEDVATDLTKKLTIPTIGIAAGRYCDGHVQVCADILGMNAQQFKHARPLCALRDIVQNAFTKYHQLVKARTFLDASHTFQRKNT